MARIKAMQPDERRNFDNIQLRKLKKPNAYSVRIRTPDSEGKWSYGKAIKISAASDREAEACARSLAADAIDKQKESARELSGTPAASSVSDVIDAYKAFRAGRVALGLLDYRTPETDEHTLKKIVSTYGDIEYEDLTSDILETGFAKLKADGESQLEVYKVYRVFKQVSKYARKKLHLNTFAFEDVEPPKKPVVSVENKSQKQLDTTDIQKIVRKISEAKKLDGNMVAVWLLLCLGLRKGELIALTWNDTPLYREDGCTYIYNSVDGKNKTKQTKTDTSVRLIETDPLTIQVLEAWREMQKKQFNGHLKMMVGGEGPRHKGGKWITDGSKKWSPNVPVCTNRAGEQLNVWTFDRYVKRFLHNLGIGKLEDGKYTGPSIHSFRRFYGSNLLSNGTPLSSVRDMLGHRTSAVTADYYNHSLMQKRKEAALTVAKTMAPDADYPEVMVLASLAEEE